MKKKFLAKGCRANVYLVRVKGKDCVLKEEMKGLGSIDREAEWLKVLNKHKIGPKLIEKGSGWFICSYLKGKRILDYIRKCPSEKSVKVLAAVLQQCRALDKLNVSKEEMHNPHKHIIVSRSVKMIDFERCHYSSRPQNVTQFVQFIASSRLSQLLKEKNIIYDKKKLIILSKKYKKTYLEKDFKAILSYICRTIQ
ncbi:MAG: hypothetical protein ABIB71_09060 [Candidatus Woesearchaeota archaeon]